MKKNCPLSLKDALRMLLRCLAAYVSITWLLGFGVFHIPPAHREPFTLFEAIWKTSAWTASIAVTWLCLMYAVGPGPEKKE